jgi:hypothetical protein
MRKRVAVLAACSTTNTTNITTIVELSDAAAGDGAVPDSAVAYDTNRSDSAITEAKRDAGARATEGAGCGLRRGVSGNLPINPRPTLPNLAFPRRRLLRFSRAFARV